MSDWNKMIQWELVLPPNRPSNNDLDRINKILALYDKNKPVAILGSTPEFREILFKNGFQKIYIFEKNIEFYFLTSSLIYFKPYENVIEGDWLDTIDKFSNFFQIILSDLTMGNIKYESRSKFYDDIYNSLLKNGLFIDRVLTIDFELYKLKDLFNKYEQIPINLRSINDFSSEVLFCSELLLANNCVDSSMFYECIENGNYTSKIKFFAKKSEMITPRHFKWDYGIPWKNISKSYIHRYSKNDYFVDNDSDSVYCNKVKHFFNLK